MSATEFLPETPTSPLAVTPRPGPPEGHPAVLFVDDEPDFLEALSEAFEGCSDDYLIFKASNGLVAKEILQRQRIDLVVTDLRMPEMDGFELLAYLNLHQPGTPVIVMTAFGSEEVSHTLGIQGVDYILNKPFSLAQLREKVEEVLAMVLSGHITGIALATVLQMIQLDRKTCLVKVASEGQEGHLQFKAGQLVNAKVGHRTGDQAALKILTWRKPTIEMLGNRVTLSATPMTTLQELLLEAFRLLDEEHSVDSTERTDFDVPSSTPAKGPLDEVPLDIPSPSKGNALVDPAPGPVGERSAMTPLMRGLQGVQGLQYAVILNAQGAPIEDPSSKAEALAAKCIFLGGIVGVPMGEWLGLGELNSALIRGTQAQLLVFKLKDRYLCLDVEGGAPLDAVEQEVRRILAPKRSGG